MRERSNKIDQLHPTASYLAHEQRSEHGLITDLGNYCNNFGEFALRQTSHSDIETHILDGPDGFPFLLEVSGPADGVPIIVFPGTPRNRIRDPGDPSLDVEDALIVAYDRRGYGPFGFPAIGREARDEVRFVRKIIEYFGFKSLGIIGRSCGAAFAAEVAAALDEVHSLALIAPMGTFALMDKGLFFEGMNQLNSEVLHAAFYPPFLREYRENPREFRRRHPFKSTHDYTKLQKLLDVLYEKTQARYADIQTYQTNDEDAKMGIVRSNLEAQIDALGKMSLGRVADFIALKHWGFCLYAIKEKELPTFLWAPESGDEFTPRAHTEFIAGLLGSIATAEFQPNATHLDGVGATAKGVHWCVGHGKKARYSQT